MSRKLIRVFRSGNLETCLAFIERNNKYNTVCELDTSPERKLMRVEVWELF